MRFINVVLLWLSFTEGHDRYTTVPLKPYLINDVEDINVFFLAGQVLNSVNKKDRKRDKNIQFFIYKLIITKTYQDTVL